MQKSILPGSWPAQIWVVGMLCGGTVWQAQRTLGGISWRAACCRAQRRTVSFFKVRSRTGRASIERTCDERAAGTVKTAGAGRKKELFAKTALTSEFTAGASSDRQNLHLLGMLQRHARRSSLRGGGLQQASPAGSSRDSEYGEAGKHRRRQDKASPRVSPGEQHQHQCWSCTRLCAAFTFLSHLCCLSIGDRARTALP